MKFTLSWLKKYIDTDATLDEILEKLTTIGIEVEKVEDRAKDLNGFVVAEVIECNKHPDADRLNVTTIDTGSEKIQVVCGAPNCRLGMKGVFAPSGSYIPGLDVRLKKAKIRGVESNGMLCSERELCLSEEHDGIIELPKELTVGSLAADALGLNDPVIEIEVTPNRGDWAGIYGIARDLAATGIGIFKPLAVQKIEGQYKNPIQVDIKSEATTACPLFIGRHLKNIKNGPSPKWLQEQLIAIGLRPISVLVDITNYFCIGLNRPLHVFDADKLQGHLNVRLSQQGEKLEALNDKNYILEDDMTVVCDDRHVLALGGVVGGVPSSCTDNTTNVYLEVAFFDPIRTAKTGRKLQINSDARYRFERAVDPQFTYDAVELASQMIMDLCGGEASDLAIAGEAPNLCPAVSYHPERTLKLTGCDISQDQQKQILSALGFDVDASNDNWSVTAPTWRPDIYGSADIVEEIIRIYGFDKIEAVPMPREEGAVTSLLTSLQKRVVTGRRLLSARGLCEAVTWAFMSSEKAELFGVNDFQGQKSITLVNPISSEWDVMRPSVLPNLIDAAGRNAARGFADVSLFEIGGCYRSADYEGQIMVAAGLRAGDAVTRHWSEQQRAVDVIDAKADVIALLEALGAPAANLQVTTDAPNWYHPGRSGVLRLGKNVIAHFGEIHPIVLNQLDVSGAVIGFEVFLENLPVAKNKGPRKKTLQVSPFQPLYRDFAFIVDEATEAAKLERAAKAADNKLITSARVFDVYAGKGIEEGKKSLAITLTLQPMEATLTEEQIEALSQKVIQNVEKKVGGSLRG